MSDYISKEETISTIWNVFNSYGNSAVHFEVEETKAIRKFCSRLQREMELLPTLDEKEIIRKAFERVVERLEEEARNYKDGVLQKLYFETGVARSIQVVKEEGGIE